MKATNNDVRTIIAEVSILGNLSNIRDSISILDQGIDSLEAINIYLLLEEKFNVRIPDEVLDSVESIDSIVEYINKEL
jgi:acyl carrier protein